MPKKTDSSKIGNKGVNKNLNDAATKGDVAVLRGELKGDMAGLRTEMIEKFEEAKQHMGVLQEETHHKLDLLMEAVSPRLERVQDHDVRLTKVEVEIPILTSAIGTRR